MSHPNHPPRPDVPNLQPLPNAWAAPITDLRKPLMSTRRRPTHNRPVRPRLAVVLAVGCLTVAAFQAALTLRAPVRGGCAGRSDPRAARRPPDGGRPPDQRVALRRAACAGQGRFALLVGLLGLGTLMNSASPGPWERLGWGPFTLVMFVLGIVLARSGVATGRAIPAEYRVGNGRARSGVLGAPP